MAAAPSLSAVLIEIGQQIDADLSQGNRSRVAAFGALASTVAHDLGPSVPREHIPWLMKWGEQFFRWQLFQDGFEYWKAIFAILQRYNTAQTPEHEVAISVAGAFNFLAGGMDSNPQAAQALMSMGARVLGDSNPLIVACRNRGRGPSAQVAVAAPQPAPVASSGGFGAPKPASSGGFGVAATSAPAQPSAPSQPAPAWGGTPAASSSRGFAPAPAAPASAPAAAPAAGWSKEGSGAAWNMAPAPRPAPPATAEVDEALAMWVTLAFLAIATADGKVDDREYLVWKDTIQRMKLPDIWDKYGAPALLKLLEEGRLQRLSVEFSGLPRDVKIRFGTILKALVLADGVADPRELTEASRILGWLGLGMADIP